MASTANITRQFSKFIEGYCKKEDGAPYPLVSNDLFKLKRYISIREWEVLRDDTERDSNFKGEVEYSIDSSCNARDLYLKSESPQLRKKEIKTNKNESVMLSFPLVVYVDLFNRKEMPVQPQHDKDIDVMLGHTEERYISDDGASNLGRIWASKCPEINISKIEKIIQEAKEYFISSSKKEISNVASSRFYKEAENIIKEPFIGVIWTPLPEKICFVVPHYAYPFKGIKWLEASETLRQKANPAIILTKQDSLKSYLVKVLE